MYFKVVNRYWSSLFQSTSKHFLRREFVRHSSLDSPIIFFDRKAKRLQKERTVLHDDHTLYDYLKEEVGWRTSDNLFDMKRNFTNALDLGCGKGYVGRNLLSEKIGSLIQTEVTSKLLDKSVTSLEVPTSSIVVDEEHLPFRNNAFDLVTSSLSLHWVNDLLGTFKQINEILVEDGCFLGTMFGEETLHELQKSLRLAEEERKGGFAAHVSPYTNAETVGGTLNRAGFVMLTIDTDEIVINYPSIVELMYDLKGMGEGNCSVNRCLTLPRETILAAAAIYQKKFGSESSKDDVGNDLGPSIPATFQIINFIAWKKDKSQAGSENITLDDVDNLETIMKKVQELKKDRDLDPTLLEKVNEMLKSAEDMLKDKNDKKDS